MSIIFLRTVIIYILIVFVVRMMGKRQIGELQPSELVITILISNIATMTIEDVSVPLISGVMPILLFMCLEIISSEIALHSKRFRKLMSGSPKIVIRNGIIDQHELSLLRFSVEDLMEELRSNNVFHLEDVLFAIVETNGSLSVYNKASARTPTLSDLSLTAPEKEPPTLIVSGGELLDSNLEVAGISKEAVLKFLNKKKLELKNIFLMTYSEEEKFSFVKAEKKK
jgi:uncharacterized membrane protein YcaP (DUF421 family)